MHYTHSSTNNQLETNMKILTKIVAMSFALIAAAMLCFIFAVFAFQFNGTWMAPAIAFVGALLAAIFVITASVTTD